RLGGVSLSGVRLAACVAAAVTSLHATDYVTPAASRGGPPVTEAWAAMPEAFRQGLKLPDWPVPADLQRWEQTDRAATRQTIVSLFGELPPRPDPAKVVVKSKEDKGEYILERFEFHNGADSLVPGLLMIPKGVKLPAPAIVGLHHYSSNKETVTITADDWDHIGVPLVKRGFAVAAIDGYFTGERLGGGPAGKAAAKFQQEYDLFKLDLWLGRNLWGMMIRDEQCLLDYLETRPEVDRTRIGATGMSMGCVRAGWLAAVDERVKATVGIACFGRYTELIAHGNLRYHSIYYFVPGMLKHFDTEALHALIAPRPHLELTGDQDPTAPLDGILILEKKLAQVYTLYGKPENFRNVVYKNTGHEYLPEMKAEMIAWFEKHLGPGQRKE
ncbi:MAG: dienelactone hydrolase family protein, partial [Planctomycetota bacterium]|nr:dienelactone hydrolase family protein [Planctomycetota bacterium]